MGTQDISLMKRFLLITGVVQVLLGGVVGALAGANRAEARVREIAAQVIHEEWLNRLATETKNIAVDAAERAAEKAVQMSVVPLSQRQASYESRDEQRAVDVERRVGKLEDKAERK